MGGSMGAHDNRAEFQFYEVITFRDDEAYHADLKRWIARQHAVYEEIVAGLTKKGLITSEQAAEPMKINMFAINTRKPSAHSNVTCLKEAPRDDVVPKQTGFRGLEIEIIRDDTGVSGASPPGT
jgi:hypothetical protein